MMHVHDVAWSIWATVFLAWAGLCVRDWRKEEPGTGGRRTIVAAAAVMLVMFAAAAVVMDVFTDWPVT